MKWKKAIENKLGFIYTDKGQIILGSIFGNAILPESESYSVDEDEVALAFIPINYPNDPTKEELEMLKNVTNN